MSSDKKAVAGVINTMRRTWDKSEYEEKAKERERKVSYCPRCTSLLVHPSPA